ncbi:MAG: cation diffusion facilitator family transporter [Candidatus Accumulibacter sp.]|jgi:cation diffusion facilitator family transporter|nr:cation diffusion facilitator family transporter [Accumulibacter sp.]
MAMSSPASLKCYAWLSIAAAASTIFLKGTAWWLTGSVGLLSDALESFVNLAGAMMALAMLTVAEQPADEEHTYGHGKAEYFSSGFEGLLILLAAIAIGVSAVERLLHGRPLSEVGAGLAISAAASLLNLLVARILLAAGREHRSLTLEADARHLLTDVWTSVGVIAGVGVAALTGRAWLDPLIALLVAVNIAWTGWKLIHRSTSGLMDGALPPVDHARLADILARYRAEGVDHHALRTRESGARRFVELHLLVPGDWSVRRGHDLAERVESDIRGALPGAAVITHVEPLEDPVSQEDISLDR